MSEWNPNDREDTQRLPDNASSQPSSAGDDPSAAPSSTTRAPEDRFGGLGFHGEPDRVRPDRAEASPSRRTGRGGVAGLLAAALVVGGVAGVAGAAGFTAVDSRSSSTPSAAASSTGSSSTGTSSTGTDSPVIAPTSGSDSVEAVAKTVLPSVVKINVASSTESGSGSGIIISSDGEILTNNHVASVAGKSGTMTVNFNDGSSAKARIVGTDPVTDLAVIKAQGVSGLKAASLGTSATVDVGENVVAIGSPFGLEATVTSGIVSALNRPVSVSSDSAQPGDPSGEATTYPAIQTDAAINPGNSGGPLVDLSGRVIGINSSIRTASDDSLGSSPGGSIGLGFAIPIRNIWPVVQQLRDGETPTHAKMGVGVVDASSNDGLLTGAKVESVTAGSAAQSAGIEKGDVITKVDDDVITSSESLVATVRGHRPGDTVKITAVRGGKQTRTFEVTLDSDKGSTSS